MSYFNTTNESGADLKQSHAKAKRQEDVILTIYQRHKKLTASDAWSFYCTTKRCPLTSARRAITNLANEGLLFKTQTKKMGMYGKPEYVYRLNETDYKLNEYEQKEQAQRLADYQTQKHGE